jgi:rhamnosyltransferase
MIFSQDVENYEVIIIDSGSNDNTIEIAKRYPSRIYEISPDEFHHSKTRNLGVELAKGIFIVFLTADAIPLNDNWLSNILDNFNDKKVGAVYGRQIAFKWANPMEKFFYSYFYSDKKIVATKDDIQNLLKFWMEFVSSNVNACYRKNIFNELKFREDLEVAEDKDIAIKILKKDYSLVYEPKAMVFHSHDYSIKSAFWRRYKEGKMIAKIVEKSDLISYSVIKNVGINYFINETKSLVRNNPIWIPYALVYEFSKYLGMILGRFSSDRKKGVEKNCSTNCPQ